MKKIQNKTGFGVARIRAMKDISKFIGHPAI